MLSKTHLRFYWVKTAGSKIGFNVANHLEDNIDNLQDMKIAKGIPEPDPGTQPGKESGTTRRPNTTNGSARADYIPKQRDAHHPTDDEEPLENLRTNRPNWRSRSLV